MRILVINVVFIVLMVIFVFNNSILNELSGEYIANEQIDINYLNNVLIQVKVIMVIVPLFLAVVSSIMLFYKKKDLIKGSIVLTLFVMFFYFNSTFYIEDKILSENLNDSMTTLDAEIELMLYKHESDSYNDKSEYFDDLMDVIF